MKTAIIDMFDLAVIRVVSMVWNLMRVFDPKPFQTRYARLDPANAVKLEKVFNLPQEDAGQGIVRLGNNRMKTEKNSKGFATRGDLVKIKNPENGKFVILYAMGAGSHPIPSNGLALDYDAKLALGIQKVEEVDLLVGPANVADKEYFLMYLDPDKSSRSARALGWYLFIFGFAYSAWETAKSLIDYALVLFA